jgi:hypothetical protein
MTVYTCREFDHYPGKCGFYTTPGTIGEHLDSHFLRTQHSSVANGTYLNLPPFKVDAFLLPFQALTIEPLLDSNCFNSNACSVLGRKGSVKALMSFEENESLCVRDIGNNGLRRAVTKKGPTPPSSAFAAFWHDVNPLAPHQHHAPRNDIKDGPPSPSMASDVFLSHPKRYRN